jgi:hypothetical protein
LYADRGFALSASSTDPIISFWRSIERPDLSRTAFLRSYTVELGNSRIFIGASDPTTTDIASDSGIMGAVEEPPNGVGDVPTLGGEPEEGPCEQPHSVKMAISITVLEEIIQS